MGRERLFRLQRSLHRHGLDGKPFSTDRDANRDASSYYLSTDRDANRDASSYYLSTDRDADRDANRARGGPDFPPEHSLLVVQCHWGLR